MYNVTYTVSYIFDSPTDALINGELFLDLPDDEEILESLKHVSRTFVKLVMKKAKEV